MKVMTDTDITIDLLLETIMLPLVHLCLEKQLQSQKGVKMCLSLIKRLREKAAQELSCNQSVLTTLDVIVKKLKVTRKRIEKVAYLGLEIRSQELEN